MAPLSLIPFGSAFASRASSARSSTSPSSGIHTYPTFSPEAV